MSIKGITDAEFDDDTTPNFMTSKGEYVGMDYVRAEIIKRLSNRYYSLEIRKMAADAVDTDPTVSGYLPAAAVRYAHDIAQDIHLGLNA